MYIQNRYGDLVSKILISLLGLVGLWLEFNSFGLGAWRLLDTWFLLVLVIYYLGNGLWRFFAKRTDGKNWSPLLNGAIIVTGISLLISRIVAATGAMAVVGLEGFGGILVYFLLPTLALLDWLILVRKGSWRVADPFYWLGLVVIYFGAVILTTRQAGSVVYPYSFLDYASNGINILLWWMALVALVVLIIGYIMMVSDFVLSGELGKHVVLPRIKTIVIEEEIVEPAPVVKEMKTAEKTVRKNASAATPEPTEKPTTKLIEKSTAKPVEKPTLKPAEKPTPKNPAKATPKTLPKNLPEVAQPATAKAATKITPEVAQPATAKNTPKATPKKPKSSSSVKVEGLKDAKAAGSLHKPGGQKRKTSGARTVKRIEKPAPEKATQGASNNSAASTPVKSSEKPAPGKSSESPAQKNHK